MIDRIGQANELDVLNYSDERFNILDSSLLSLSVAML